MKKTVYYNAEIKITVDSDDDEVNYHEIADNISSWISETACDDTCWGDGSVDWELTSFKRKKKK